MGQLGDVFLLRPVPDITGCAIVKFRCGDSVDILKTQ